MFITPAFAQAADAASGTNAMLIQVFPFILIFVVMYFLLIRPQQRKQKEHQEMIKNLRRGDVVVLSGGLIGKITKVADDGEIVLDIGEAGAKVLVRAAGSAVQQLRAKGEPVKDAAAS
jgi:preprotein translocase subunit YajC